MLRDQLITIDTVASRLETLGATLGHLNTLVRILGCLGVWQHFERLRSQAKPFDRVSFLKHIDAASSWAERYAAVEITHLKTSALKAEQVEGLTAELYANCWKNYSKDEFVETVDIFERRFRNKGVDPSKLIGKDCLDAGCGSGRFSIAMHYLGARRVTGIDLSSEAIDDARLRRDMLGISPESIEFQQSSLLKLPDEWGGRFEFVCSNGVMHHTTNPVQALTEVHRVMKRGASGFLFVYGAGGLHWLLVEWVRSVLKGVVSLDVRAILHLLDLPPGRIFHIMDHWFVPNYEYITAEEYEQRLLEAGFVDLYRLPRGLFLYDSSERMYLYPEDRDLFGDGELRYMVLKA